MKTYVDDIVNYTNYAVNCHGLQSVDSATEIAKHYFEAEGLSFDGWRVREIPLVDNSGKYPVAVVLCVNNKAKKIEISLNLTRNGDLFSVNPDEAAEIELTTIKEAIEHPTAKY